MTRTPAARKTRTLSPGIRRLVPLDYPTIQSAINASVDGDTVLVSEGTYFENIRYRGKAITVASLYIVDGDTTHIERTTIDGSRSSDPDSGSSVSFVDGEDTTSVIYGVTIQGGTGTNILYAPYSPPRIRAGGGILCNASGARIVGNIITRNRLSATVVGGGGVCAKGTESYAPFVILEGNRIRANFAQGSSATLWAISGGVDLTGVQARIVRNAFERDTTIGNSGALGGGMWVSKYSEGSLRHINAYIRGNVFQSNIAIASTGGAVGGGLSLYKILAMVSGNMFAENVAEGQTGGGAGLYIGSSSFRLENNEFTQNTTTAEGGGVLVDGSPSIGTEQAFVNNTVVENHASVGGGGLLANFAGYFVALNSILWNNAAGGGGADLDVKGSITAVEYCDVEGGWPGEGNVSADPRFMNSEYRLSDSSACIGAGVDSLAVGGVWYYAPATDYGGFARPEPPGSWPDLGSHEHPFAIPIKASSIAVTPLSYDFCNVRPGSVSDTIGIVITNKGTSLRQVSSLSLGNRGFHVCCTPALPVTLPPYDNLQLGLFFCPTVPGITVSDTLVLITSDPVAPRMAVPLTGRGSGQVQCARSWLIYGVSASSGAASLFEVDRLTGGAKLNAQFSPELPSGLCAFAVCRMDNLLYGAFSSAARTDIYRLSSASGDNEFAGSIPLGAVTSMAFSAGDTLYLTDANGRIYRTKGITADTVLIGQSGHLFTGLSFSPVTGELWGSAQDTICTINTLTGDAAVTGYGITGIRHSSISFSPIGTLYGLFDNTLAVVDRASGRATVIGQTGVDAVLSIAMRSDPAPADVGSSPTVPKVTELYQNYPNPFNPSTSINFQLSSASFVTLKVYDILGREVAVLVNEQKTAGESTSRFDASQIGSGVYFYHLEAQPTAGTHSASFVQVRKMIVVK